MSEPLQTSKASNPKPVHRTSNQILWALKTLQAKHAKWDIRSVEQSVLEAKVDLNPHQIEATVFAFRNPMNGGVILADEVGLGKTIEAGIILSQLWSENRKRVLIIAPKSLRHQWQDELRNLFDIPSAIIDTSDLKTQRPGSNPLERANQVVITNEHLIARCPHFAELLMWDCVVIDEAHKLANVWRPGARDAKRAKSIRKALATTRKILLTATPMQNNLMELYGLVSFVDDRLLGTPDSFKATFNPATFVSDPNRITELRQRLHHVLHRNLRKNVSEYINYKRRTTITARFDPGEEEDRFRTDFEEFLRRGGISLAAADSALLKLLYLKLLASSPRALRKTILNLMRRLLVIMVLKNEIKLFEKTWQQIQASSENGIISKDELSRIQTELFGKSSNHDFSSAQLEIQNQPPSWIDKIEADALDECTDNEDDDEIDSSIPTQNIRSTDAIARETELVFSFLQSVSNSQGTAKSNKLLDTLNLQFEKARKEGWPEKAVIFTEFRTTQSFVLDRLIEAGFSKERDIVIFNGDSGGAEERRNQVQLFKNTGKIFLTTEAGAEGLNLQFCNLVINFDLPWNPQRIEQRIGRCHRYGQKLDVIVVNFVNSRNPAEERILSLLQNKFEIFEGAFGVSDQVIGSIASGANFEREIVEIYLKHRSPEEIEREFNEILIRNKAQIEEKITKAWEALSAQFNEDVRKKLKTTNEQVSREISKNQASLKELFIQWLNMNGIPFDDDGGVFRIKPFQGYDDFCGEFTFRKSLQNQYDLIHPNHRLALRLEQLLSIAPHISLEGDGKMIGGRILNRGDRGKIWMKRIKSKGIELETELFSYGILKATGGDFVLGPNSCEQLLSFQGNVVGEIPNSMNFEEPVDVLERRLTDIRGVHSARGQRIFLEEESKFEGFISDLEREAKAEREIVQKEINDLRSKFLNSPLDQQLSLQTEIQKLKDKQIQIDEKLLISVKEARSHEKAHAEKVSKCMQMEVEQEVFAEFTFEIS